MKSIGNTLEYQAGEVSHSGTVRPGTRIDDPPLRALSATAADRARPVSSAMVKENTGSGEAKTWRCAGIYPAHVLHTRSNCCFGQARGFGAHIPVRGPAFGELVNLWFGSLSRDHHRDYKCRCLAAVHPRIRAFSSDRRIPGWGGIYRSGHSIPARHSAPIPRRCLLEAAVLDVVLKARQQPRGIFHRFLILIWLPPGPR